jgi:hypothetical protein
MDGWCGCLGKISRTKFNQSRCSGKRAGRSRAGGSQLAVIEELCIHIYKQRKKINVASERQAHRPFVSVAKVTS